MSDFDVPEPPDGAPRERERGRRRGMLLAILRALLVLGLLALFLYAVWQCGWPGVIAWLLTVWLMIDTSVNVLFALYDEPGARRFGWLFWIATVFWGTQSVQMVRKDGTVRVLRPAGPLAGLFARFGGPAIVVIDNGMAALFERSGRFTRVHGPGIVFASRFERVAYVVDLRRQVRTQPVEKIMTRDGLSFDLARLDVLFEVASDFDPQRGEHAFSEQALLNLVYRGGFLYDRGQDIEWGRRVFGMVEYYLRNVAAGMPLRNIVRLERGSARQRFMHDIEELARDALQQIGVRLIGIDMGQIIVPKELEDLLTLELKQEVDRAWFETQREAITAVADSLADAIMEVRGELERVDATRESKQMLLLSLVGTLQQISSQFLQLAGPYRSAPEIQRLLAARGEQAGGGEQH